MTKLLTALSILILCSSAVLADEINQQVNLPVQDFENNTAAISIQKQPANKQQKQVVKQNKWCIIIQVNGKVQNK